MPPGSHYSIGLTRPAPTTVPERVLYGRRKGRPLRPGQRALVDNLLPRLEIRLPPAGGMIDPRSLFATPPEKLWIEVGFGAGEHLEWQAGRNPAVGMIGCEPFLNGIARILTAIDAHRLTNIRLMCDDARMLLAALPDHSVDRAFVLFPDPWPKTRHHKRRFICAQTMAEFARIMVPDGELRIVTDDTGYQAWILEHVLRQGDFTWMARRPGDWRHRPDDWPATRYEAKAMEAGRRPAFFRFRRRFAAIRRESHTP